MQFTTLVPAYKPKYLVELLTSLRHQTIKPAKILFSDDSPDQSFIAALSSEPLKSLVADMNVEVILGPRTGGYNNFRHLLRHYSTDPTGMTELFHLLLDDDLIYPSFYDKHLSAHQQSMLPCVVSRRWAALETGQPIRDDLPVPSAISDHPYRFLSLETNMLFGQTVGACKNWLGEFSNTTFRAAMAPELVDTSLAGISFAGLEDLGGILKASQHGSVGYINDFLGSFRLSTGQNSANPMGRPMKLAFLAYISLAISGRNLGYLNAAQSLSSVQQTSYFMLTHYGKEFDMTAMCALMPRLALGDVGAEAEFLARWRVYSDQPA
jgi:hypothetical protein